MTYCDCKADGGLSKSPCGKCHNLGSGSGHRQGTGFQSLCFLLGRPTIWIPACAEGRDLIIARFYRYTIAADLGTRARITGALPINLVPSLRWSVASWMVLELRAISLHHCKRRGRTRRGAAGDMNHRIYFSSWVPLGGARFEPSTAPP